MNDSLAYRSGEQEWYARNRGRFDIIGQLGMSKAVWGFEIDSVWGTTAIGGQDNNLAAGGAGTGQHNGATSAFDINTDTQGSLEQKWLYVEFPLPLMPIPIIARLGAQPFATQYKQAAYANGDFAGVNLDFLFNPNLKGHLTYVAIEENLTGYRRNLGFGRGDDWAMIASVEITPLKGLDIRPIYSFVQLVGSTSASTRSTTIGGIGGSPSFNRHAVGGTPGLGMFENRHTVGVDARWRWGAFSLDPTAFYQFGTRDTDNPFGPAINSNVSQADISAWLFDVIGGCAGSRARRGRYLQQRQPAEDQLNKDVNYQPLDNDTGTTARAGARSLPRHRLLHRLHEGAGPSPASSYGRNQFAVRAIHSWRRRLTFALASPMDGEKSTPTAPPRSRAAPARPTRRSPAPLTPPTPRRTRRARAVRAIPRTSAPKSISASRGASRRGWPSTSSAPSTSPAARWTARKSSTAC